MNSLYPIKFLFLSDSFKSAAMYGIVMTAQKKLERRLERLYKEAEKRHIFEKMKKIELD